MLLAWAWTPALAIGGAILAAGPIIIHLLNRRRFKILDWAAMRFLLESRRKNRRRLRIEELILLALRVLVCLLIGLALANIRGGTILGGAGTPIAHVFIVDDSLSMGQRAGGSTIFAKAVTSVADLVATLPDGDAVAFVSATQPEADEFFGRLVFAQDLRGGRSGAAGEGPRLTALKLTDLRARFPEALAAARKVLAPQKDMVRRVYLVSDFRRTEFADRAAVDAMRKGFADLADDGAELVLLDYGLPARSNLAIEKVELLDRVAVAKVKARLQVSVRNHGTDPAENTALTVQVGGATLPAIPLDPIGPGERAVKSFTYTFAEPGSAAVRVSVTPDLLPADNTAVLAVPVHESVRVLLVDGAPDAANPVAGAAFCLARAIDPNGTGEYGQRADIVPATNLTEVRFDDYDAVILANVGEFPAGRDEAGRVTYPQLAALADYVREGGGLAVFLGDRVNLDFYNGPMLAAGAGLSPLRLAAPVPATPDPARFVRLRPDSIAADPMLRVFTGRGEAFTRLVRFYVYMPAAESASPAPAAPAGPAQVLARFDDRDSSPAVVRRAFGRGTVMMWYSSADVRWTDWPKDLTFLPVINDMVAALARSDGSAYDAPVGVKISHVLPPALADATAVTMTTPAYPEEDVVALVPRIEGKRKVVEYAPVRRAGLYELKFTLADKSERSVRFSRHVDPAEGALARADAAEIERAVGRPHTYQGDLALGGAAIGRRTDTSAYAGLLLAAVLALLAVEIFLAQRFGHYPAPGAGARIRRT